MQIGYAILSRAHKHQLFPNVWILFFFAIKKNCNNYLEISLGHKITHSLDHPDGFSVRLCESVKNTFASRLVDFNLLHLFTPLLSLNWMNVADINLHTWTLISIGKNIKFKFITAPSTSKASPLLLVFLWMWWRWVTERTKAGNFQGLHISRKIISTKLRVIVGHLASIIMLWELLNRYYLTGSLPWKSSERVCEVGAQRVLC